MTMLLNTPYHTPHRDSRFRPRHFMRGYERGALQPCEPARARFVLFLIFAAAALAALYIFGGKA